MRRLLLTLLAGLMAGLPAFAQAPQKATSTAAAGALSITLKDGRTITTDSLRREGDKLMVTVLIGTGKGEVGYAISTVAKVDFPEPPQLKVATNLLNQGKAAEALAQLNPIVTYYTSYRDVPGGWWVQSALLKLNALLALGREKDAEPLIDDLAHASADSETVRMAKVQQAANWTRKGLLDKAGAVYDEVIKESANRDTLAQAWLNKGHNLLAQKEWEDAVLAYLHLPVYYPDQKLLMPPAMLGSARALVGLDDSEEAQKRFQELIDTYPNSPEATAAKAAIEKLKKKKS